MAEDRIETFVRSRLMDLMDEAQRGRRSRVGRSFRASEKVSGQAYNLTNK